MADRSTDRKPFRKRLGIKLLLALIAVLVLAAIFMSRHADSHTLSALPAEEPQDVPQEEEVPAQPEQPEPPKEPEIVTYNYSLQVPRNEAVDETYFNDAIFIGNSRTEGFILYSGLANATSYTSRGLMVNTVFTDRVINMNGKKISVMAAVQANPDFSKVYIMLGTNELGWVYSNLFIKKYGEIIDALQAINPEALIYVQSILPVTKSKSAKDKIYNNPKINQFNALLSKMAEEKKIYYLNVAEAVADSKGNLPEGSAYDGVHLKKAYCIKWLEYLKCHTVEREEHN
jgi:hypothetical protein